MPQKKVLIVEDEGVVALSLQSILTKMGYMVIGTAITGNEAIKLVQDHHPDVILMDIHIKGSLDGIQTTEKINEFSDVPVIYLTAYADEETVSRAIRTRSHSYLVKPVNPRELYSNIEFAIYNRQLKDRTGTSQENLELILTNAKESGFVIDLKNRIVYSNPAAEVLTGYRAEEIKGMNFFDLMNLAPSQRGDAGDEMVQKILTLNAIDYLPPVATFSSRSGKRRTVIVRAGMIREDNDGEHKNVFIMVREMDPVDFSK